MQHCGIPTIPRKGKPRKVSKACPSLPCSPPSTSRKSRACGRTAYHDVFALAMKLGLKGLSKLEKIPSAVVDRQGGLTRLARFSKKTACIIFGEPSGRCCRQVYHLSWTSSFGSDSRRMGTYLLPVMPPWTVRWDTIGTTATI